MITVFRACNTQKKQNLITWWIRFQQVCVKIIQSINSTLSSEAESTDDHVNSIFLFHSLVPTIRFLYGRVIFSMKKKTKI